MFFNSQSLVVIKNVLVSVTTLFLISIASKNLPNAEFVFFMTMLLFFNLQNSLYEGLFSLHILSYTIADSKLCVVQQRKYKFLFSILAVFLLYIYFEFSLLESVGFDVYICSFLVFLFGIISISSTNIYCNEREGFKFFFIDIVCLLFSIIILCFSPGDFKFYLLLLALRNIGSVILYVKLNYNFWNDKTAVRDLCSYQFFTSTFLSVIRDSVLPLLFGSLLGANILVSLRIFNTILSAPGLLANSMNKVVVRYIKKQSVKKDVYSYYILFLYFIVSVYFLAWFFAGESLSNFLFADKLIFDLAFFKISLLLFTIFWPLGQLLIIKNLVVGDSRYYLNVSLLWALIAVVNFMVLYKFSFDIFMVVFGFFQITNLFLLLKYKCKFHDESV